MDPEIKKEALVLFVMFIFLSAGILIYNESQITKISSQYESNLLKIKTEMNENRVMFNDEMNKMKETLDLRTKLLQNDINQESSRLEGSMSEKLSSIEQSNQGSLVTLSQKVSEINSQSSEKISQLSEQMQTQLQGMDTTDLSAAIGRSLGSVLSISSNKAKGSGVIVASGYAITNYHVIEDASYVAVMDNDKNIFPAVIIKTDENLDLALLQVKGLAGLPITFGNSDSVRIGQRAVALGCPAGFDFTATQGIVSAVERRGLNGIRYIQTDVPLNPGSSGGPLIDNSGSMIGLNTLKAEGFEGISLAIPSSVVKRFIGDAGVGG